MATNNRSSKGKSTNQGIALGEITTMLRSLAEKVDILSNEVSANQIQSLAEKVDNLREEGSARQEAFETRLVKQMEDKLREGAEASANAFEKQIETFLTEIKAANSPPSCSDSPTLSPGGVNQICDVLTLQERLLPLWALNPTIEFDLLMMLNRRIFTANHSSIDQTHLMTVKKNLQKIKPRITSRFKTAFSKPGLLNNAIKISNEAAFEALTKM